MQSATYGQHSLHLVIDGHRVTTGEKYTIIEMGYVGLLPEDRRSERRLKKVSETIPPDDEDGRNAVSGVTSDPVVVALAYGHWWASNSGDYRLGPVPIPSHDEAIEIVRNRRILNEWTASMRASCRASGKTRNRKCSPRRWLKH